VYLGTEFLSLDAKGRLSMPARHRLAFTADEDKYVTITRHEDGCLLIFQRLAWEHFREHTIKPQPDPWLKRVWLGSAMEVKLDNTFRLLISPELRAAATLNREVKLVGMDDHFELWDKAMHDAMEAKALEIARARRSPQLAAMAAALPAAPAAPV